VLILKMKIVIVDKDDKVIGLKEKGTLDFEKDFYRVSALWIKNSKGKSLLAQRAFTKKQDPGVWGPAVAGTIEEGETYDSNIIKETEEEIGLKNVKPEKAIKEFIDGKYKYFTQLYFIKLDKDSDEFKFDKKEVEKIGWFIFEEILELIENKQTVTLSDKLLSYIKNK